MWGRYFKQDEIRVHGAPDNASNAIDYGCHTSNASPVVHHHRLQATLRPLKSEHSEVSSLIATETRYLKDMEERYLKKPDLIIRQIIDSTAIKLAKLFEKADLLNQQIQHHQEAA